MYPAWDAAVLSIVPILVLKEWSITPMLFIKSFMHWLWVGGGGVDYLFPVLPLFFATGAIALFPLDVGVIVLIQ